MLTASLWVVRKMATKLYVANLPQEYGEQELHDLFAICGPVAELDIIKNYAFVHMGTNEAAQKAVAKYNNSTLNGRVISVQFSKTQNVNRANKSSVRYDRPDRMVRGGQVGHFQRGGLRGRGMSPGMMGGGGVNFERGDHDFRGRGGFRGGRSGPDSFHRGKPYDRNPNFNHNQPQTASNSSNLKAIQPMGPDFTSQPQSHTNLKMVQNQQNMLSPQNNQAVRMPIQVQIRPTGGGLQQIPVQGNNPVMHPQHPNVQPHQVIHAQPQMVPQNIAYQQMQQYRELPPQAQAIPVTPQQMAGPGVIQQQQMQVGQTGQPMSNVQSMVQPAGMAAGMNYQQSGNPLQGYTVYERYVDYRNPQTGDVQQVALQNQVPTGGGMPAAAAPIYHGDNQIASKDPYANAQLMYERQAAATSRAAIYAFPNYGGSPATTMMSGTNMMQVVSPATVIPSVQMQYQ